MKIVFVLAAILALASAKSVSKSSESEKHTIGKTLFTPYSIGSFTKAFAYHVADFLYYLILEAQKHDYTPEQFSAFLLKEEIPKDVAKYFADQYVYYKSLPTGTPAYDIVRYYFSQGIPMSAQKFLIEQYALFFQQFNTYLSKSSEKSSVEPKFTGVSSIVVEYFMHFLYPTDQHPTEEHPTKQFPAKQYPSEQHPTEQYPSTYHPTSFEEKYKSAPFSSSYGFYNPYSSVEYQYGPYSQSYKPYSSMEYQYGPYSQSYKPNSYAHSFEYTPYQYGSYGSSHDLESYKPYQYGHNQEAYPYGYPGQYATAA